MTIQVQRAVVAIQLASSDKVLRPGDSRVHPRECRQSMVMFRSGAAEPYRRGQDILHISDFEIVSLPLGERRVGEAVKQ